MHSSSLLNFPVFAWSCCLSWSFFLLFSFWLLFRVIFDVICLRELRFAIALFVNLFGLIHFLAILFSFLLFFLILRLGIDLNFLFLSRNFDSHLFRRQDAFFSVDYGLNFLILKVWIFRLEISINFSIYLAVFRFKLIHLFLISFPIFRSPVQVQLLFTLA